MTNVVTFTASASGGKSVQTKCNLCAHLVFRIFPTLVCFTSTVCVLFIHHPCQGKQMVASGLSALEHINSDALPVPRLVVQQYEQICECLHVGKHIRTLSGVAL